MNIIDKVKKFVEEECKKPTSKYGYEPFEFHFVPVVNYAKELADELGGDKEVIEIAVWLHDIGSIMDGRGNHHETGAKIAEGKLAELNYPPEKIKLVKKCILNHRGSQNNHRESIEEQIIAETDVLSAFENIGGLFKAAFIFEGLNQKEAQKSVRQKLENKWGQLHFEESRVIIKPKYKAAMVLLK